jgi:hypothetical protein
MSDHEDGKALLALAAVKLVAPKLDCNNTKGMDPKEGPFDTAVQITRNIRDRIAASLSGMTPPPSETTIGGLTCAAADLMVNSCRINGDYPDLGHGANRAMEGAVASVLAAFNAL